MNYSQYVKEYGLEEGKRRWTAHTTGKRKTSGFAAMTKEQGKKSNQWVVKHYTKR